MTWWRVDPDLMPPPGTRVVAPASEVLAAIVGSIGPLGAAIRNNPALLRPLRRLGNQPVIVEVVEVMGQETAVSITHLDGTELEVPSEYPRA